ncbi:hypothetical protein LOC68_14660 [Blastopirellula sp. JC732]|uniref:Secreted protein n=1 Tax=Blastopirellula sediminis TaxID=2894196 RepID=A0A9X1MPG6_9BACT|nr:hypothetical protein [Blastopirellula sediminis]MCC9607075.1 hypothetical protein [Blastopirellula sediminis]MCC9629632.1 hypothetical protein [Blastopirellula sediminis]
MAILRFALLFSVLTLALGCGGSSASNPPELTQELQEKIKAEDAAVEDAERAASDSYKPAKKK